MKLTTEMCVVFRYFETISYNLFHSLLYSFRNIRRHVFLANEHKTPTRFARDAAASFIAKTITSHASASRIEPLYIQLKSTFSAVPISVATREKVTPTPVSV